MFQMDSSAFYTLRFLWTNPSKYHVKSFCSFNITVTFLSTSIGFFISVFFIDNEGKNGNKKKAENN